MAKNRLQLVLATLTDKSHRRCANLPIIDCSGFITHHTIYDRP